MLSQSWHTKSGTTRPAPGNHLARSRVPTPARQPQLRRRPRWTISRPPPCLRQIRSRCKLPAPRTQPNSLPPRSRSSITLSSRCSPAPSLSHQARDNLSPPTCSEAPIKMSCGKFRAAVARLEHAARSAAPASIPPPELGRQLRRHFTERRRQRHHFRWR